jgi:hypothetical protein
MAPHLILQIDWITRHEIFELIGRHTVPFQVPRVLGVPIEFDAATHHSHYVSSYIHCQYVEVAILCAFAFTKISAVWW